MPTQEPDQLREDITTLIRFWQVMHSEKKYLMMGSGEGDYDGMMEPQNAFGVVDHSVNSLTPTGRELMKQPAPGWINTVPLSTSSNALGKRSNRSKRIMHNNVAVKDYIKKRNLILGLLAEEIELLLVRAIGKISHFPSFQEQLSSDQFFELLTLVTRSRYGITQVDVRISLCPVKVQSRNGEPK